MLRDIQELLSVLLVFLSIVSVFTCLMFLVRYEITKNEKIKKKMYILLKVIAFLILAVFGLNSDKIISALGRNISLTISVSALIITIISPLYNHILFNYKVSINKEKEYINGEVRTYLKMTNNSNKDLKVLKIKINDQELTHEYNNVKDKVENNSQKIDGVDYHMFKYDKYIKMNRGTSIKIKYNDDIDYEHINVLNVKMEVEYTLLSLKDIKVIETDLSPYV